MVRKLMFCPLLFMLLSGCGMLRLKGELKVVENYRHISGKVVCDQFVESTVVVVLWALDDSDLSNYWLIRCGEEFEFHRDSGRYYLMAFADANEDGRYQRSEYGGVWGDGKVLDMAGGDRFANLELKLLAPGEAEIPKEVILLSDEQREEKFAYRKGQIGEMTSLDNPLFSDESGAMGLWTPLKFIDQIGVKIYFLEEYDPAKTPVLFVHGSSGHPALWKHIVENLDREKYQPWFVFYPSGARLDWIAGIYAQFLDELYHRHGFKKLHVVAHSMGGLVAGEMVREYGRLENRAEIPVFISLATPWAGHSGAKAGMHAPVIVPAWYDMVPGSAFQRKLEETPLPPETQHWLLFAYKGSTGLVARKNNDGVVSMESQLSLPIQRQAFRLAGFNTDHVGILSDAASLDLLNEIQRNAEAGNQ